MKSLTMPVFYYPTQILLLDDNAIFVNNLNNALKEKGIVGTTFTDPMAALKHVCAIPTQNPLLAALHREEHKVYEEPASEEAAWAAIRTMIENPKRQTEITVVIADYEMPEVPGDVFFAAFSHPYVKKIMLTGRAAYEMAVKLFNQRVFNHFLVKDVHTTNDQLYAQIVELQQRYFLDIAAPVVNALFINHPYVLGADYAQLVEAIIQQHGIVEHYTLTKNGSKCLRDAEGRTYHLALATHEEMEGFVQTAELSDTPEVLLQSLRERTHFPVLLTPQALSAEPARWNQYLHPAHTSVLEGQTIYWTMVAA